MKKRKIAFLAGLLACSLAGVATASALIVSGASITPQQGTTDSVLYLNWDTSTEDLRAVSNLTPTSPEFRVVSVAAPQKSTSAPNGKFTVTLGVNTGVASEKTLSAAGISVDVFDAPFDQGVAPAESHRIGAAALVVSDNPATATASDIVSTAKSYYLKISISSEAYAAYADAGATSELAAKITFSYGVNE